MQDINAFRKHHGHHSIHLIGHGDAGNDVGPQIDEENGNRPQRKWQSKEDSDDERNHFRHIRSQDVSNGLLDVVKDDPTFLRKKKEEGSLWGLRFSD